MERGSSATLVRICDLAGRPLGTGFVADESGTVVTGRETVDGPDAVLIRAAGGRECTVGAEAVTLLPGHGLALVRTPGLAVPPLPIGARDPVAPGTYVRLAAGGWREARVLGAALGAEEAGALELAMGTDGSDALRRERSAVGGPVLDAVTGAVLAVLAPPPPPGHRAAVIVRPLRPGPAGGPLAALLRHNAATVPAYGEDLNLAAVLELTAASLAPTPGPSARPDPVERPEVAAELAAFTRSAPGVLGLVGAAGTGRTTELSALAGRRSHGPGPAPTLWLRGADLHTGDTSIADAMARTLLHAARIRAAAAGTDDLAGITPRRAAQLAREADRPLLVVLDGPEEMPPALAHRLAQWASGTADWVGSHGVHLVVGCGPEHWEQAAPLYRAHAPGARATCTTAVRIGDLGPAQARLVRERYGLPEHALAERDAQHPLALRLLAEVRRALPAGAAGRPGREEIFAAWLDLLCLRVAVRVAAAGSPPLRGSAVRRLATRVAGQVHEAARCCLGSGPGALDRRSFEALFPWASGWAPAVLTEGLLVPAGAGYRFAHQEFADWIQGAHLDLATALRELVHRRDRASDASPPVPHHCTGPVVQAMLLLARQHGPDRLAAELAGLVGALDRIDASEEDQEARWWAVRLLTEVLGRVPDAEPYTGVLRQLARHVVTVPADRKHFGPAFWARLPLGEASRLDLLRRLVPADPMPGAGGAAPRYLDLAAQRLASDPRTVQPLLCRWFTDDTPLAAGPDAAVRPTVSAAAQALLYARRGHDADGLTEALVATPHPRAFELLAVLADDLPAAYCRAVHRWARDPRPDRRAAAAAHARAADAAITADADRELLRSAAAALLVRPGPLSGPALALLVRDPVSRGHHLDRALARFADGDPQLPPAAFTGALSTHPGPVLAAFRTRLLTPGAADAGDLLDVLARATTPTTARPVAALVCEYVDHKPGGAAHAAAYVEHRLEHRPIDRAVLFPLVTRLLRGRPARVRSALAPVLAAPGSPASRPLRTELLDMLLCYEQYEARDLEVLEAVLRALALGCGVRDEATDRALLHRTGLLLVRSPGGAARLDRRLVELARAAPCFAAAIAGWLAEDPQEWALVAGPHTWRALWRPASQVPMRSGRHGHGSLRPA
ncbi:trypsin-like peptidase domain-containing protein [Streptomyces sp. ISL-10]|uniref:trypsin-like peptidase domain-containing protein n=1 Tax=Streptomyces sp. ISL-10 TaxID=2819172 RepID=UPI001BE8CB47|nr:trypsin-like peptidase domain-containing protein [Streptomyces sp. ISL-10]MBT2369726.1 trypsin-like peptidase domain-containing protein [Streptomyces sp. ISL-10]